MSVNLKPIPWSNLLGLMLVSALPLLSAGCSDDQAKIEEATSTDQPVITSQSTVKPPGVNQTSTMEVKDKQLMDDQPQKQAMPSTSKVEEKVVEKAIEPEASPDSAKSESVETVKSMVSGAATEVVKVRPGNEVYAMCVGCHGAAGEGGVGPRLSNLSEQQIVQDLLHYKAGKDKGPMSAMMIPNAQQLPDEEIHAVAKYIQSFQ